MKSRVYLAVASFILGSLAGFFLSHGGSSAQRIREWHEPLIGLSMDTLEDRWQHDRDIFEKRARDLGAKVLIRAAERDDARQISDVQALISERVDVLVIVPHSGAAMARAVNMAHEADIPVLAYDRLITDCDL